MSIQKIILGVKLGAKHAVNFCKRHAPQIMVITGVAGFGATAVATGHAAIKAKDILEEKNDKLAEIENGKFNPEKAETYDADKKQLRKETAVKLIKTFAPSVTLGAASAALVLGGHHILGRRTAAALASAYEAQKKLYAYDSNVKEAFGEDIAKKLREGLAVDKLETSEKLKKKDEEEKKNPKSTDVKPMQVPFMYDRSTCACGGAWSYNPFRNWSRICGAYMNSADELKRNGHISINEILWREFGHPSVTDGNAGWIYDKSYPDSKHPMQWYIETENHRWTIEEFCKPETEAEYEKEDDYSAWIVFMPTFSAEDLDKSCRDLNYKKHRFA